MGLLIYPSVVDPALDNPMQTSLWSILYFLYAAIVCLFLVCMVFHGDLERGKPDKPA